MDDATLLASAHIGLTGSILSLDNGAIVQAGSFHAQLAGPATLSGQSTVLSTGLVEIAASAFNMDEGAHFQGVDLNIQTSHGIRLSNASMVASGHTSVNAASLDVSDRARIQSSTMEAAIDEDLTIDDAVLLSTSNLDVDASNLTLGNGSILQGGVTDIKLSGSAVLDAAHITATGDLKLSAGSLALENASEAGGVNVALQLSGPLQLVESTLYAKGNLLAGSGLFNNTNGRLFADGNMTLKAAMVRLTRDAVPRDFNKQGSGFDLWKHAGVMYAGGDFGFSAEKVMLEGGFVGSGRNLNVVGRGELTLSGNPVLYSGGNTTVSTQAQLSLVDSIFSANGSIELNAKSLSLNDFEILAGGNFKGVLAGSLHVDKNSAIYGMGGFELAASELTNEGLLFSGDGMGLYVSDLLTNQADILAVGSILMRGRNQGERTLRIFNDRSTIESLDGDLGLYAEVFENYGGEVSVEKMYLGQSYQDIGISGGKAAEAIRPIFGNVPESQREKLERRNARMWAIAYNNGFYEDGSRAKIQKEDEPIIKKNANGVKEYLLEQERLYGIPAIKANDGEALQEWVYLYQDKLISGPTPANLMASGNMVIEVGKLTNKHSNISAGQNMSITADVLENVGTDLNSYRDTHRRFVEIGRSASGISGSDRIIERLDDTFFSAAWVSDWIPSVITAGGHMDLKVAQSLDNRGIKENANYVGQSGGTPSFDGFYVTGAGVYGKAKAEAESLRQGGQAGSLEREMFELENALREILGLPTLRDLLDQTNPLDGGVVAIADVQDIGLNNQPAFDFKLPELGKLFALSDNPEHNYVIETNPRLTQLGHYYGSDYFLSRVGYDLAREQVKLLGDSFYETRLIREQLLAQSGQRFIFDGISDDAETVHRLMDNAADVQAHLGLSVGIALSPEQASALTKDIVWLVSTHINGQTVLVPRLYLCEATRAELTVRGASITADTMNVDAEGFNNSGMLRANELRIASASDILNRGGLISGKEALFVSSDGSILNQSGSISGGNVSLVAARDIRNETLIDQKITGKINTPIAHQTAQINATGDLELRAGRDIVFNGAFADAKGKALLLAENDVILDARGATFSEKGKDHRYHFTGQAVSGVSAGEDLGIKAGQTILLKGSGLEAGNDLSLVAGEGITSLAVNGEWHYYSKASSSGSFGRKRTRIVQQDETAALGSVISAGNDLHMRAKDVTLQATYAQAGNDALVVADRNITLLDATNSRSDQVYESKTGFGGLSGESVDQGKAKETAELSWLAAGNNLSMVAGENIGLVGGQLVAGKDVNLNAGYIVQDDGKLARSGKDGSVSLMASHELSGSYYEKEKYNLISGFKVDFSDGKLFVGVTGEKNKERFERDADTIVGSSIAAGGDVSVNATADITLEGADVNAGKNITFTADNDINIIAAKDLESTLHRKEKTEIEMGVRIGNAYVDAAQAIVDVVERADDIADAKAELDRMERLHAEGRATDQAVTDARINLAMAVVNQGTAIIGAVSAIKSAAQAATAAASGMGTGFYASIGASATTKTTETTTHTGISKGSDLQAGGDILFDAGGSMAQTGSRVVSHEGDVLYKVANDLFLTAGDNTYNSNTKTKTATAGFWIGTNGFDGAGDLNITGVSGSIGGGKSKSSTNDLTWTSAYTQADNGTIRFDVGNYMRAEGYTAHGKHIDVNVGGDLNLISKQNSHSSSGKSWNASAGLGTGSISGGFGKHKSSENRLWTDDISSLVGTESVSVDVGGKLHMEGSLIANIREDGTDGGNLTIAANELTFKNLQDYNKSSETGFGISISTGNPLGENNDHPEGETTISMVDKGHEIKGVTRATIGQGDIILRDGTDVASIGINRDITNIQEITSDKVTGALDFEVTLDNRIFTPGGWASISDDFVNLPDNMEKAVKGAGRAPVYTGAVLGDILGTLTDGLADNGNVREAGIWSTIMDKVTRMRVENEIATRYPALANFLNGQRDGVSEEQLAQFRQQLTEVYNLHGKNEIDGIVFYGTPLDGRFGFYDPTGNFVALNLLENNGGFRNGPDSTKTLGEELAHVWTGSGDDVYGKYMAGYHEGVRGLVNILHGNNYAGEQGDVLEWVRENKDALALANALVSMSPSDLTYNDTTQLLTKMAALEKMAGNDPQRLEELTAAACALTKCSEGFYKGSPEHRRYSRLEQEGGSSERAGDREALAAMGFTYGWLNAGNDFMESTWLSQAGKGAAQNILDKGSATVQTAVDIAKTLAEYTSGGNLYPGTAQKLGEGFAGGLITLPDVSRQMLHEFANINPGDPYKLGYTAVDAALIVAAYKQTGSWSSAYQRAYASLSAEGRLTTVAEMSRLRGASYADPSLPYVPGRAQSRINIANNRTTTTPLKKSGEKASAGFDHVLQGHFKVELAQSRSVFSITPDELKSILQSKNVVSSPVTALPKGYYVRTVDVGKNVGTTSLKEGGVPTSVIKIYTDRAGNLITTYPVRGGN